MNLLFFLHTHTQKKKRFEYIELMRNDFFFVFSIILAGLSSVRGGGVDTRTIVLVM